MSINKVKLSASEMKWHYGCNHYSERDKIINTGTSTCESPRCSEIETWEHIVQCSKTVSMRAEFIFKSYEDLKRFQFPGVTDEELRTLT